MNINPLNSENILSLILKYFINTESKIIYSMRITETGNGMIKIIKSFRRVSKLWLNVINKYLKKIIVYHYKILLDFYIIKNNKEKKIIFDDYIFEYCPLHDYNISDLILYKRNNEGMVIKDIKKDKIEEMFNIYQYNVKEITIYYGYSNTDLEIYFKHSESFKSYSNISDIINIYKDIDRRLEKPRIIKEIDQVDNFNRLIYLLERSQNISGTKF